MIVLNGSDLWELHEKGHWIVVTTNTQIKEKSCKAIMGKGIALEAATRFPELPSLYGYYLNNSLDRTNIVLVPNRRVILFPTKIHWKDNADIQLITKNTYQLQSRIMEEYYFHNFDSIPVEKEYEEVTVYLPPLGCGNGNLNWEKDVYPVISPILFDNRFITVIK